MTNSQQYQRPASYEDYSIDLNKAYYQRILSEVRRYAPASTEKKVLDIGCFDGTLVRQLLPQWVAYGIEGNLSAAERAKQKGVKTTVHDLDGALPYNDEFFDCVIAAEIIEHVYDTGLFLREIRRVLKPGGILLLSTPNIACLANRIGLLFGRYPRYAEYKAGGAGHIRIYTSGAIRDQILEHGFQILRYAGCNLPLPMHHPLVPHWIKKIAIRGGDFFPGIAGQVVITAKK